MVRVKSGVVFDCHGTTGLIGNGDSFGPSFTSLPSMNVYYFSALAWLGLAGVSLAGSVYWTDRATGAKAVRRMGLNGAAPTTTVPLISLAASADPRGIALDATAGKFYFGSNTQILQANLDGTGSVAKVAGLRAVRDV